MPGPAPESARGSAPNSGAQMDSGSVLSFIFAPRHFGYGLECLLGGGMGWELSDTESWLSCVLRPATGEHRRLHNAVKRFGLWRITESAETV